MMWFWLFIIWGIGTFIDLVCTISALANYPYEEWLLFFWKSPKDFYEETHMNWFGCWFTFTILQLLSPPFAIIRLIVFLFHIGRND